MPPRLCRRFPDRAWYWRSGSRVACPVQTEGRIDPFVLTPALGGAETADAGVGVEDETSRVVSGVVAVRGRPTPAAPAAQRAVSVLCFPYIVDVKTKLYALAQENRDWSDTLHHFHQECLVSW